MKRPARLLTLLIVLSSFASAHGEPFPAVPGQLRGSPLKQKYLITPDREIVPVKPGEGIQEIIQRRAADPPWPATPKGTCPPAYFGYPAWVWWTNVMFGSSHNEIIAQWFDVPVAGTIDSVFWVNGEIGNYLVDSTVHLRIHRSTIGSAYGPGVRPGPFDPPCQPWGYWENTNDLDGGIAAFPEDATDTTWLSAYPGGSQLTLPPIGEEVWGGGGYPVKLKADAVNAVGMEDLSPLSVELGDRLFISIRTTSDPNLPLIHELEEVPTRFGATAQNTSEYGGDYPSRNWKFYEHGSTAGGGPSVCGTHETDSLPPGWYARGGLTEDSTDVMAFDLWYTMTVTGNAPPSIYPMTYLGPSFDTGPRAVHALIADCYGLFPENVEVASARIVYTVDDQPQPDVSMNSPGSDSWSGSIPGQPAGSTVSYRIVAVDLDGDSSAGPTSTYRILGFGNAWYALDTGYVCAPQDISLTGSAVDPAGFFLPPYAPAGATPADDGTAGPVDLGANFSLFGDDFRYAWIGVDGGISLSKSPADTHDVNAAGFWQSMPYYWWTFPFSQKHDRSFPEIYGMPPMFIASLWANHLLQDTTATYGRILTGDNGDSCLFVVQWDSVADFGPSGLEQHGCTFRLVLNRCTGVIEFQYDEVQGHLYAYDGALSGMQADSNDLSGEEPGWVLLSQNGAPEETAPQNGRCIRMIPTAGFVARDGWNLVALSYDPLDGDHAASSLFPQFDPFVYENGFRHTDTLPAGAGFWIKSSEPERYGTRPAGLLECVTVEVRAGWNIVGGPSCAASTAFITPIGTSVSGNFFGYGPSGYFLATALYPGYGYWVIVTSAGQLDICCDDRAAEPAGRIAGRDAWPGDDVLIIRDASGRSQSLIIATPGSLDEKPDPRYFELPPAPPDGGFDVRFASGRLLEVVDPNAASRLTFPIMLSGVEYPVTVSWNLAEESLRRRPVLTTPAGDLPIQGSGSTTIDDPSIRTIALLFAAAGSVPAEYTLEPNFPNPFNASTIIRYSLPEAGHVTLSIYDVLGRTVRTLNDGPVPSGVHAARWDGTGDDGVQATSGVFIVRISAGGFSASRKILLLK